MGHLVGLARLSFHSPDRLRAIVLEDRTRRNVFPLASHDCSVPQGDSFSNDLSAFMVKLSADFCLTMGLLDDQREVVNDDEVGVGVDATNDSAHCLDELTGAVITLFALLTTEASENRLLLEFVRRINAVRRLEMLFLADASPAALLL